MSDRSIEKSFLYLIVVSLLLHLGAGALLYYLPQDRPKPKEPVFIDLQNMPVLEPPPKIIPIKPPQPLEKPIELPKEIPVLRENVKADKNYYVPKGSQTHTDLEKGKQNNIRPSAQRPRTVEPELSDTGLLKPKNRQEVPRNRYDLSLKSNLSKSIEDQLRNKNLKEEVSESFGVLEGVDGSLTSFSRRFLKEANNHLIYPPQAKQMELEGIGNVEVTFNRKGEIIDIHITNSAGKDFDEAVMNALKKAVVGPMPKAYTQDTATFRLTYVFRLPPKTGR